ncbi:sensor histidine kinase [Catenuloplanes indicus]|uniref:histidine kinase n=1 Tax=Catenuloplanes indicus TaxID=137267 RepID=A0AAE3VVN8_9ACTN|nr:HAMP domain-containing sensor histidine kinase [Catenuloplanes indicus]MDQ0365098.1 signal transduction histidine kinase [Catenuloplanes indicus]
MLFAFSGLLGFVGLASGSGDAAMLWVVIVADVVVAAAALILPWQRWHSLAPALLSLPALAILALSTWAFGGIAAGTGPFFVVLFGWVGLRFPRWTAGLLVVPAAVAYVVPLVAAGQPAQVISSVVLLIPVGWGIAVLIAEQQRAQRVAYQRLEQLERRRADVAAALAHDVRSPLNSIQLVLETVRDEQLASDERTRFLDAASRQVERVVALSEYLLDVDMLDQSGQMRLARQPMPLRPACLAAMEFVDSAQISLVVGEDLTVFADPQRLQQMLVSLLINALRQGRGPVTVSAYGDAAKTHIRVCHQGTTTADERPAEAIRPEKRPPVAPEARRPSMSIARQLAQAHGGDLRYELGTAGGCYIVHLPGLPR